MSRKTSKKTIKKASRKASRKAKKTSHKAKRASRKPKKTSRKSKARKMMQHGGDDDAVKRKADKFVEIIYKNYGNDPNLLEKAARNMQQYQQVMELNDADFLKFQNYVI